MEDDQAFNSLPQFICKRSLAKILLTRRTETCQEMLCTAGKSVTVPQSMLNTAQEEEEPSWMMIKRNSCRPLILLQSWCIATVVFLFPPIDAIFTHIQALALKELIFSFPYYLTSLPTNGWNPSFPWELPEHVWKRPSGRKEDAFVYTFQSYDKVKYLAVC